MTLTREEYDFCAQPIVEESLRKARARYNKPLGRVAVQRLMDIYRRVSGQQPPRATSCGRCELDIKARVAQWYFADKEAYESKAPSKAVQNAELVAEMAKEGENKPAKRTRKKKEAEV